MKNGNLCAAFGAMLLALCSSVAAQQPAKIPRIGFLAGLSVSGMAARSQAFRQGLLELGYVEGKNVVIEWRYARETWCPVRQIA